jgi:hypothetical protein
MVHGVCPEQIKLLLLKSCTTTTFGEMPFAPCHISPPNMFTSLLQSNHAPLTDTDINQRRYHGQFYKGQRSGYGVLYYATGARYEGCWAKDKKEGEGCYLFENGEVGF